MTSNSNSNLHPGGQISRRDKISFHNAVSCRFSSPAFLKNVTCGITGKINISFFVFLRHRNVCIHRQCNTILLDCCRKWLLAFLVAVILTDNCKDKICGRNGKLNRRVQPGVNCNSSKVFLLFPWWLALLDLTLTALLNN